MNSKLNTLGPSPEYEMAIKGQPNNEAVCRGDKLRKFEPNVRKVEIVCLPTEIKKAKKVGQTY